MQCQDPEFIGPPIDPLTMPEFLRLSPEQRAAGWIGFVRLHAGTAEPEEAWQARERERRAAIDAVIKTKTLEGLAKMKAKHPGENWDPKTAKWVTATVKLDLPADVVT